MSVFQMSYLQAKHLCDYWNEEFGKKYKLDLSGFLPKTSFYYTEHISDVSNIYPIIDPRKQDLSRYATYHLQFNPGQDLALLNALIFTIIRENLTNKEYINTHTEGFDLLEKEIEKFNPVAM